MTQVGSVLMTGVQIIFRNFSGTPGPYNREGKKEFGVLLPPEEAAQMANDGWNVKYLKPREEDEDDTEPKPWLPVKLNFAGRPPTVAMITSRGRTNLTEDMVPILDSADIVNVDIIVNPSDWEMNGKSGIAAYVKTLFVTIEEDALEAKYAELDTQ